MLSLREVQVLELIAAGNSNKLIGAQLFINEETVKGYIKRIFSKLQARDRTHAVMIGLRRGIIRI
jgi:DNA-binding NarL/FixJ family response regulator